MFLTKGKGRSENRFSLFVGAKVWILFYNVKNKNMFFNIGC